MSNRFIVIVLDSFGIGAMDDVIEVRPEDLGANTSLKLMKYKNVSNSWKTLESLGLMNAIGNEMYGLNMSKKAIFGKSKLKHYGADTFYGHQEMIGTDPKKPIFQDFNSYIDNVEKDLIKSGYEIERICEEGICVLKVDDQIIIGDNMETDLGQAINVVGALDHSGWDKIKEVGFITRKHFKVPRVIAFGGSNVTIDKIEENIIKKDKYMGVDAPSSGVYDENYHVIHIGYGVDPNQQIIKGLDKIGIRSYLYGKVADIIVNEKGVNNPAVDTGKIFNMLEKDIKEGKDGFYFVNIQETDLAGHAQDPDRYIDRINLCNKEIEKIINLLDEDDILLVTADHGNDPFIGHSRHTREKVPVLVYRKNNKNLIDLGTRESLSDIGATVFEYFGGVPLNGISFLSEMVD